MNSILPCCYLLFFVGFFSFSPLWGQYLQPIPEQFINFEDYLSYSLDSTGQDTVEAFAISNFITYQEYKIYLQAIQKDSSPAFVLSQQPDSNIAPSAAIYAQYVHSNLYDKEPVVGISWDAAMNYCKWKTLQDNPTDSLTFIYRIPHCKEWVAAYHYYNKNQLPHDMNQHFADWLLEAYYANWSSYFSELSPVIFLHQEGDHSAWRRKLTIGNSYRYTEPRLLFYKFWFFANTGHRHLGFRIVKSPLTSVPTSINQIILAHWKRP